MNLIDRLSLGYGRKVPLILQTEATECGTVCLSMVAAYHGLNIDIRILRRRFPVSLKGATLSHLIKIAKRMDLATRAIRLELSELPELKLPCILHWNFNHFVVLKEVTSNGVVIHDPARGVRQVSLSDVSAAFTGVALELWPTTKFAPRDSPPQLKLRSLMGSVTGLKRSLVQVFLLAFSLEIFAVLSPLFLQWILDGVIVSGDRDLLTTLVLGFGLLMLIQQLVSAARSWVLMHMSTTVGIQWRANVFGHLLSLPTQYFEKRHIGEIVSRFGSVDSIQQTLTTSFLAAILDGIMTLVTLVMMFVYSATLGWIAIGTMTLYAAGRALWYRPLRSASEDSIIRAAQTQSHFLETVRGIRAIQLFQRQDERRSSWLTMLIQQVNANLRTQKLQLLYQQWNGFLFGVETLVVIWLGTTMVMDGHFSVGMLIAFNSYKGQFDGRVSRLIDNFFAVKMLQLQGERLADIVLTPPEPSDHHSNDEVQDLAGSIEVCGVQYRYAHGEPTILNGIDFKVAVGESVAIVGPTGCGKTTLLNIMLGILSPTRGQIKIDGIELSHLGGQAFRGIVGTVMQDDVLFAGSIADNISFFDTHVDHDWIVNCSSLAAIHNEIVAMPMGYNTLVGDMGTVLSGGQKQRILLARALYKRPKILFLDEATCHLDVERERELVAAIKSLKITRVTVAHRPETIASADRVIVLGSGMVVKDGPPSEIELEGGYAAQKAEHFGCEERTLAA